MIRFSSASDGERLEVLPAPWEDPFIEPTDENLEYIQRHGKWQLEDMSPEPGYRALVEAALRAFGPLTNRWGVLIGVQLQIGSEVVNLFVHADELCVSFGRDSAPMWRREWSE